MIDGWLKLLLLEKVHDGSLLLSINEITHYFKKWTTGSGVLKKISIFFTKNVMLQIDPLKSSCSQRKQKTPKELLRSKVLRKSSSLGKVAVMEVTIASAIVCNCSSKISAILYE